MQIEVEEIDYCKLNVHYEASFDEIEAAKNKVVDIFKKAPVPGFRPGKASPEAIKNHYKSQINESVKRSLAEEAFHNTLFEKSLKPFGAPQFTGMILTGGKFTCDFKLSVHPTFTLGQYKELEVPAPALQSTNEIAEQIMQQVREQHGTQIPYVETDFVQINDSIIIDYNSVCDGVKIDSLSAQGEMLRVGASSIKEFDDNLLGMKIGDNRVFNIKVPEDGLPSVAGKEITFDVTLIAGAKINPAPLDDELAKKLGKETFEEFHTLITQAATGRVDMQRKGAVIAQVTAKLVANHDFKVPDWLAVPEGQYIAQQAKVNWDALPDQDKERFINMGANNAKISLILDKIRDEEPEAQLSDQEVIDTLKTTFMKSNPDKNPEDLIKELSQNGYLQSLFVRVRDEHVLGYLATSAKIIE
jgi:trigger factor